MCLVQTEDAKVKYTMEFFKDKDSKTTGAEKIRSKYEIIDGRLYGKLNEKSLWFVPKTIWWKILEKCHDDFGHLGPGGKREGMLHSIDKVGEPFHTMHMDHLGPFLRSS
ncbi:hypothetical protein JTB14_027446 [Gonioctena quinquepunctata]|nr:hypothetical protein JTB14_027446 [Gonioctena quinquepunctata]